MKTKFFGLLAGIGLATMLNFNSNTASASTWASKPFACATNSDAPCPGEFNPGRGSKRHEGTYSTERLTAAEIARTRRTHTGYDQNGVPMFNGNSVAIPTRYAYDPNWDYCQHFVADDIVPVMCAAIRGGTGHSAQAAATASNSGCAR